MRPTITRLLRTIYNDVYDEHFFVFVAGLSDYFVLSTFPFLVALASMLSYVPIPRLFEDFLSLMARLVPGDGMMLVHNIVSDVISHKHPHFLTLGLRRRPSRASRRTRSNAPLPQDPILQHFDSSYDKTEPAT